MRKSLLRPVVARCACSLFGLAVTVAGFASAARAADDIAAPTAANAIAEPQLKLSGLELEQAKYLQIANPADKVHDSAPTSRPGLSTPGEPAPPRLRSFEMPAVDVVGERPELKEEELIGPAGAPRWTADRRFPSTRIYVLPENTVEFEFWVRPTSPAHGGTEFRSLWELEFGLPYRLQLDLYFRTESELHGDVQTGESIELRYAFADWNKIWGNPTLYAEWSRLENEADEIEFKLLLGGEIAPRWHWGINLSDELQTGGDRGNEIEFTGGISYTIADSKFSVGAETEIGVVDTHGNRGTYGEAFCFVGPSIQWRPYETMHIDLVPMIGLPLKADSDRFRVYFVVGYEF